MYSKLSYMYNLKRALPEEFYIAFFERLHPYLNSTKSWLDLGCGSGRFIIPAAKSMPQLSFYGVDISGEMIHQASVFVKNELVKNINLIQADINRGIPFTDIQFDVICLFQSIHYFFLSFIFYEINRLISNNGILVIATTTHEQFHKLPYCSYQPILRYEIQRTPDYEAIVKNAKRYNLVVKYYMDYEIYREFERKNEIIDYLKLLPYSAYCVLDEGEVEFAISKALSSMPGASIKSDRIKYFVDAFRIIIFKKNLT